MNSRIRRAYLLIGVSIAMAAALGSPEVNRSKAKAHVSSLIVPSLVPVMAEEGTVTLKPSTGDIKTWRLHNYAFPSNTTHWPCSAGFTGTAGGPGMPKFIKADEIVAGYDHYFEEGSPPLPCQMRINNVYRGSVWFDLSEIRKLLPGVFVKNALLHFRSIETGIRDSGGDPFIGYKFCANELLVASVDWRKGFAGDLPPGAPFKSLSVEPGKSEVICGLGGCTIEVGPVVNNWVTGKEDDFGFIIKGEDEAPTTEDNAACWTRYGDFELTVNYKADTLIFPVDPITPEDGKAGLTNFALASNGAKANASSTYAAAPGYSADKAIDGEHRGLNWSDGGGWNGAGPTNSDSLEITLNDRKSIDEIDVFMLQDNYASPIEPNASTTFTKFGLENFRVQYRNQFGDWVDVPGGNVTGNKLVWRKFTFVPSLRTRQIQVLVSKTPDGYSRITEVEAWGKK